MAAWVDPHPVKALRVDPKVRHTGLETAGPRTGLEVEGHRTAPVEVAPHMGLVEELHIGLVGAHHGGLWVVRHSDLEEEHCIHEAEEGLHILAVEEEHRTVLGAVVRHTG